MNSSQAKGRHVKPVTSTRAEDPHLQAPPADDSLPLRTLADAPRAMSSRDSGSVRDSVLSSTSRFSSLLSPAANSTSHTSTFPLPSATPALPPLPPGQRRTSAIYDRPLVKSRGAEVSLGAWAFLFAEIVQYTQKRVSGISEFEKRCVGLLDNTVGGALTRARVHAG